MKTISTIRSLWQTLLNGAKIFRVAGGATKLSPFVGEAACLAFSLRLSACGRQITNICRKPRDP